MEVDAMRDLSKITALYEREKELIEGLSSKYGLSIEKILAVLAVETNDDDGFTVVDGEKKLIIRLEVHKLFRYVESSSNEAMRASFKRGNDKSWLGHKVKINGKFESYHGNQSKEHHALDIAAMIDFNAAYMSVSMGLPQMMGFNFKRLGYGSAFEMYDDFNESVANQIEGFFNFFTDRAVRSLRIGNYVDFAKFYNGLGQAVKYGRWIAEAETKLLRLKETGERNAI